MNTIQSFLAHKAYALRVAAIKMTSHAGSGHVTSALSAADIVSVLFFYAMRYDPNEYNNDDNDRFILSKGHAAPLLYAVWHELGYLSHDELLLYRSFDSVLEGHPTSRFMYAEGATGSLGIGLSMGLGQALSAFIDGRTYRIYVLMGDSELSEGSVWEAIQIAAYYKCHNLIGIIDVNNLGQSTETMLDYDIESYKKRCEAFGWYPIAVNGHSIEELMAACDEAHSVQDRPVMIIARTIKGYGVDSVAGKQGFHGKAFNKNQEKTALEQLKARFPEASEYTGNNYMHLFQSVQDEHSQNFPQLDSTTEVSHKTRSVEKYEKNTLYATRKAYGNALADLGSTYPSIVCLDAEVKNSTYAELFEQAYPGRFLQCFVAEQNMVGMGIGFQKRGKIPFISTFSSFFSRAHDQIRMAAVSCSALRLVGSHCGVSIGEDGPSQMGLEDIAMMRCLPGSVVLYPSDAVSTYKLVEQMVHYAGGVSYLRTTRMETPVIYNHNQEFYIGGCTVLRHSTKDVACIVAAGVTLHEALKAHAILSQNDIFVSVIDLYSVKPLDASTVISVAQKSNNRIITVEDHYAEGGIGEAVLSAVCNTGIATHSLSVTRLPRSGKPEQLLAFEQIDAAAIVHLVQSFC